ncbi:hypothetical protein [Flavobacterium sp. HJSW_4]|uniref:hypothetical protein n=1 Tax=Flavobacterium sp. HJSW_4 TaxID=3344660 RepID=UPI0035F3942F
MIKDLFVSFTDNFKEKTNNPFLGTYLLVWLIRNWDLIYSLFNFDKKVTRWAKIQFVKNYYHQTNFIENLLVNILWSFGLLILTYILLNISRFIVNVSEKRLTPWIYQITDSKSIVLKEEYDRVRAENDDLQTRLDNERQSKSRLETIIKAQDENIIELSKLKATNTEPDFQDPDVEYQLSDLVSKIINGGSLKSYEETVLLIQKGKPINDNNKNLDFFITLGLIAFDRRLTNSANYYKLTQMGKKVLDFIRIRNIK